MDQFVEVMIRMRRGLDTVSSLESIHTGVSDAPVVPSLVSVTLNASRAVRRVELEVVRVLDGDHVAVRSGWVAVASGTDESRTKARRTVASDKSIEAESPLGTAGERDPGLHTVVACTEQS